MTAKPDEKTFRLEKYGPVITPEMRAIRADEVSAQEIPALGAIVIEVGSGVCHCGDDADHDGWFDGHSPVEMMEQVQVNAAQVEILVRAIQAVLAKHKHALAACDDCARLRAAMHSLNARSV